MTPEEIADAIRAYGAECRRAALEEACRAVCMGCSMKFPYDPGRKNIWHTTSGVGWFCTASAIRRLMEQEVRDGE